jgi:6-pyruvoyl-tetrahydropterin synthase
MTTLTGVGCHFSAAHEAPEGGSPHGHSYEVTAWFEEGEDARHLQKRLLEAIEPLDHSVLTKELASGEAIASHLGRSLQGCVEVEVRRPLERIYARWRAA